MLTVWASGMVLRRWMARSLGKGVLSVWLWGRAVLPVGGVVI